MAAINSISSDKLYRLIGTPSCPLVIDVRTAEAAAALPALIPAAIRRSHETVREWAAELGDRAAVVACRKGGELSAGVAAWLRALGVPADMLEGGIEGWAKQGYPLLPEVALPPRDAQGRTLWVTRARPKVDRIACPWLIRRFIDRGAVFLFVAPSEIEAVAARFDATPFDVEGVHWSHRGELCSFDVMVEEFGLCGFPALERLKVIVRGADTARPELAPQAAGLLAVSLGLSRLHGDDHEQLDAGLPIYDALYRWCRDAADETHDWVSHTPSARVRT
jgi:rhodanese-related sulfurtransferase